MFGSLNGVQQSDCCLHHFLFVFGRSSAKISAGFTDVSGLAIAAFDRVYCSLSVLQFVIVFDRSKVVELVVKWL